VKVTKKEKKPEVSEKKESKSIMSVLEPLKGNDNYREIADLKQKLKTSKSEEEKKNKIISSLEVELKQYRANDPKKERQN